MVFLVCCFSELFRFQCGTQHYYPQFTFISRRRRQEFIQAEIDPIRSGVDPA